MRGCVGLAWMTSLPPTQKPSASHWRTQVASLLVVLCGALPAARGQDLLAAAQAPAKNTFDAGLVLALPVSLATGMSAGVGLGYLRAVTPGGRLLVGARASWSTATEYTLTQEVRDDDIHLRLNLAVQQVMGRGAFGLRLGLGATTVYEGRTRSQGNRAGLEGTALSTSSWYLLPAAEVEGVVFLRVWGSWGMTLSGGPTLHLIDGSARFGWSSGLGVLWQP
jgi:hypothetical protein